jgi:DNA mismatch repair protein MutS
MEKNDLATGFSLLYPADSPRPSDGKRWGGNAAIDLDLDGIAHALTFSNKYLEATKAILLELCGEVPILEYRHQILEDFLNCQDMAAGFEELLPMLAKLRDYASTHSSGTPLQQTLGRLTELNTYVACVRRLQSILEKAGSEVHSPGLAALGECLAQVAADETFLSLEKELPEILSRLNGIPSVTIGVNLDSELQPVEATLLAIHDKPFKGNESLLGRLMGKGNRKAEQGIGPLHAVQNEYIVGIDQRVVKLPTRADPLMVPLFRDLYEILKETINPITAALNHYARVHTSLLTALEAEIAFYLGAVALIQRLRASGLPMCRPKALPMKERLCQMKGMHNLLLALALLDEDPEAQLDKKIVLNNIDFGPQGRIFILTGPNLGGKTVYTQAVGLAQVLFQAGLYVPAERARMSPVDGLFTHFATLEESDSGMGRLGEEAERLNEIFQSVTSQGLVLLNESLSSTSPRESLYLARDIVRALRLFGVRAIYSTHMHELAEGLEAINTEVPGDSQVVSLVAGVALHADEPEPVDEVVQRTYKIKPGPPRGLSYAKGIAARHGISYEQLEERWKKQSGQPAQAKEL